MDVLLSALLVFALRLLDVPLSTVRMLYMVRGERSTAALLAFFESLIWLFAITRVFAHISSPAQYIGWAAGFATGTALGMAVEGWLAPGQVLLRIITRKDAAGLVAALRESGYGVTEIRGEGKEGPVSLIFVVSQRRQLKKLLRMIEEHNPAAFVTVENTQRARGGHLQDLHWWPGVRK